MVLEVLEVLERRDHHNGGSFISEFILSSGPVLGAP